MKIPQHLKGKALYEFLVTNKKALINEKKSIPVKFCDSFQQNVVVKFKTKSGAVKDAVTEETEDPTDTDVIRVEVIANTALWMDSQSDVLLVDAAKRSIQQRKMFMVHISNHDYKIQSKVGEVVDVQLRVMDWKDLGVNIPGQTQVIVFITDVMKSYDEKIFNQYKAGKINQHSIGLCYVSGGLELAINDPLYEKEIDFWNKYIDTIGNKDEAIAQGWFWVVSEIKLLENSAVLFGSNILTPTLTTSGKTKDGIDPDDDDYEDDPPIDPEDCTDDVDMSALLTIF